MTSLEALCQKYGLPVCDLSAFGPQPEAVAAIPLALALRLKVVPLSRVGCVLTIAVGDPLALPAIDSVRFHSGLRVETVVAPLEDIEAAIPRFYGVAAEMVGAELSSEPQTEVEPQRVEYTEKAAAAFDSKAQVLAAAALLNPFVRRAPARRPAHAQTCWYVGDINQPGPSAEELMEQAMASHAEPMNETPRDSLVQKLANTKVW